MTSEPSKPTLSPEELLRYNRHIIMPEIGVEGQEKLKRASILIIGAGGLGSPAALYLAAAGVGTIGIVDHDEVDLSNLQRQILHSTESVGRSKLHSAKERLAGLNPNVNVVAHPVRLTSANAMETLRGYDVVIDGTDNFPTRYLVNDACVLLGKPNVYGSIFRFEGQASVFDATRGPCYRCLYAEPPPPGLVPNCAEGGVLGVLPGIIGTIQAIEAIKLILQNGELLVGRLILFDALKMRFKEMKLQKSPQCPVCGDAPTIKELIDYDAFCGVKPAQSATKQMSVGELKVALDEGTDLFLLDVREKHEHAVANLNGYLIPLGTLPTRIGELDPSKRIVVYCHHGIRSMYAVRFLNEAGFTNVLNLTGGIDAWSREIDPTVRRY